MNADVVTPERTLRSASSVAPGWRAATGVIGACGLPGAIPVVAGALRPCAAHAFSNLGSSLHGAR